MIVWVKIFYPGNKACMFLRWYNGEHVRVLGKKIPIPRISTVKGPMGLPYVYLKASCSCSEVLCE